MTENAQKFKYILITIPTYWIIEVHGVHVGQAGPYFPSVTEDAASQVLRSQVHGQTSEEVKEVKKCTDLDSHCIQSS